MIAANVPITTATAKLLGLRPATRSVILTNASTSAGNATFTSSTGSDGNTALASTTVAPGASTAVTLLFGDAPSQIGASVTATAATTATVSVQTVPL